MTRKWPNPKSPKRNAFEGICYRCNKTVVVGDGYYERYKGKWRTQHASCCNQRKRDLANARKEIGRMP